MPDFTVFKGAKDGSPFKTTTSKPDGLTGDQVVVRVTASGVCGTDLHYKHADMVLGHEGVGVVEELGPDVKYLKKGDRVGWGYETNSCGHCAACVSGQEMSCPERSLYGFANHDQGSFSSHAIWREAFLHPIPDGINDEHAAPLQCAGATVFTALYDVKPTETVGILGVGGLGHLAIQFAAKMGCRVVVLSGSDRKREQAKALGAHRFIVLNKGKGKAPEEGEPWLLSRLLVTTSAQPDWEAIIPMMAPQGRIWPLSVDAGNLVIPYMSLLAGAIRIQGSLGSTRTVHRDMLAFAARHGINPVIEKFPMTEDGIKEAMEKLEKGDVHYRAVLVAQ
ncbi:probable NADP-dependent alcohol dehydrogenase [Cephalotrichum gorgonifer]|uniref:Probable NADP-dependent alcohol dehydrogenase n=1 Tax=Cephalotrichum gorgonifer TaxID=2041049 RepID=A0AAE8MW93_9PEZI|nr:probable NADP-dependent alcohol dehydrogenase [Cephalotrichum gorgonifer]